MSRRSSRSASGPKQAEVSDSVRSGLASIVQGNADVLRSMLGLRDDEEEVCSESGLVTKLLEVMGVNSLNAEVGTMCGGEKG